MICLVFYVSMFLCLVLYYENWCLYIPGHYVRGFKFPALTLCHAYPVGVCLDNHVVVANWEVIKLRL